MTKIILLGLLLVSAFSAQSQETNETTELYLLAIVKDVEQYDKYIAEGIGLIRPERLIIQKNEYFDAFPKKIYDLPVIELTSINAKKIFRQNDKSISYLKLEPIKLIEGQLVITITKIAGKLKNRNNYILSYGDWTDVYFSFNCTTNKWEYVKTELRGI